MKKSNYSKWFFILLSVSVSIWPALYSGFPLVTSDSGTYISSGLRMNVPLDRPIGYGFFVLLSSFKSSLWLVIFTQGLIFTLLIRWLCKKIFGEEFKEGWVALLIILISFGTSAAWFNAQLMADAFSGLLLIAIVILFLERENKKKKNILSFIILFFLLAHTSHILILLAFSLFLIVYCFLSKRKHFLHFSKGLLVLSLISFLIISTLNAIKFKSFSLSPVSHMFMISRMVEEGLVDQYLEKECSVEQLSLCAYQGKLGNRQWEFMWGQFPHNQEGSWLQAKSEYNKIIFGILKDPRLLGLYCLKTIEGTFRQLFQVYSGDGLSPQGEGSQPYDVIEKFFPHQLKEYRSSLQMSERLPLTSFNVISILISVIVCLISLFLFNKEENTFLNSNSLIKQDWISVFQIVLLFLILNAFVTATFSTVIARLQSRVFWVLPAISMLWILYYYQIYIRQRTPKINCSVTG